MSMILEAQVREKREKLAPDLLPAVIYGNNADTQSLKVKKSELQKMVSSAGESNIISLKIGDKTKSVLIKEVQRTGLSGNVTHVDFLEVNMKNKLHTEIPLHFVGESKAVREMAGSLIKDVDSLEVECLPEDLVDHIDIDISVLKEFHDNISIHDLVLPHGIKLLNEHDHVIISVIPPRVMAEEPVVEKKAEAKPKEEVKPTNENK
ncbi:MAG: 50S ribosomal protein L25 [Patescibacteria group bacterium]